MNAKKIITLAPTAAILPYGYGFEPLCTSLLPLPHLRALIRGHFHCILIQKAMPFSWARSFIVVYENNWKLFTKGSTCHLTLILFNCVFSYFVKMLIH